MDLGIRDRTAAVAAATSGLGFASALALAAEGVTVVICGRDRSRLDDAVARIGHGAVGVVADVGSPAGAAGFVADAIGAVGPLDILVTNAGGPPAGNFAQTDVDAYPPALDLNLMSVVAMCKAAVPAMQQRGWGRVVAITSLSVRQPMAQLILSNTARAGATAFLKTLAREVAADGVTVNGVQPGLHLTARLQEVYGDTLPDRPLGDPADFGRVVAFLCSKTARFTTGVQLHVDGGDYQGLQ
ncbi:MAG: SDR family oxidoreductase [Ilumatobacteraceae bacterium]